MLSLPLKSFLLRLAQGIIIGAGAILPGISGGVLAVVFGIYRPMMEILTHPKQGLQKHFPLLLPVALGWALGFLGGGGLIVALFSHSETVATCLFIGLILGTLPDLWAEAGLQGRTRHSYLACFLSFAALSAVLLYTQYGAFYEMPANFGGFLFCGALWGLSFIVPGLTSSSILMAVGLLTPMVDGITNLDISVLFPWLLGMGSIILLLARLVDHLFKSYYSLFYHAVFGIVLASTLVIIPFSFLSNQELILSLVCAIIGAACAYFSAKIKPQEP